MSADRALLEAAARAAGIDTRYWESENGGGYRIYPGVGSRVWNALHDDGDALRLAVRLGISIVFRVHEGRRWVESNTADNAHDEWMDDPVATRRTIVRAAAFLGGHQP